MNVEHLECKVKCENVTTVVNDGESALLVQRNVQSPREERVEAITRVQVTVISKEITKSVNSVYLTCIVHTIPLHITTMFYE